MALWHNIRFSLRILKKHWKLTSIAVSSMALALAAATIGFSVFNALLLRPPAVLAPDRLLTVYSSTPTEEFGGFCDDDYAFYRDHNEVFSALMAFPYSISMQPIAYGHRTKSGLTNAVSDTYFSVLGVQPMLGRGLARGDDDKPSALAVLSYSYWNWIGADPNIVGKTVSVNNVPLTVIGVMQKSFVGTIFSDLPDVWYPLSTDVTANHQGLAWRTDRTVRLLRMVGRLKPGVTREQALAKLQTISKQLASTYPKTNKDRIARVAETRMLPEDSVSSARIISAIIFAIAGLVLFAACSNVANLLLALASTRRHEILVRAALGATRGQLTREVMVDSTLIAGAGGVLGFFLALLGLRQLLQFKPFIPGLGAIPITIDLRPDMTVMAATAALIFLVGLTTGVVPGLYSSTPNLAGALSGEIAVGGTRKGRIRNSLVAVQVAVCTLVFIGVGLCFRSLNNLRHVNLGFAARNIAILTSDLQSIGTSEEQGRKLYAKIREAASQTYGVESVSLTGDIPVSQNEGSVEQVRVADSLTLGGAGESVAFVMVDENYFSTLGIPLLTGRVFTSQDPSKTPEVIIVNHWMAEKYWPGQNPVGKMLQIEKGHRVATVVGVVPDGKYVDVDEPPRPFMYFDLNQHYQSVVYLLARTKGAPRQWLTPLSEALQKAAPGLFFMTLTIDDWLDFALFVPRITLFCIVSFGGLAFMLATVGLYGAVFYSVSERKKELGIRAALGANPRDLWNMILRQTSVVTATGVSLGILAGVIANALVRSLLYGIHPVEWTVFSAVALTMAFITVLTAYSAARPWVRTDPMEAIRHV
ncbi:MAG TPA: ADOP family duplicated permease [Candidatus Acidoferrum sp.]|nr:ADOP family duplicated permease [Candidatus Acidoferrum sp.]